VPKLRDETNDRSWSQHDELRTPNLSRHLSLNAAGAWLLRGKSRVSSNGGRGSKQISGMTGARPGVCLLRSVRVRGHLPVRRRDRRAPASGQPCEAVPAGWGILTDGKKALCARRRGGEDNREPQGILRRQVPRDKACEPKVPGAAYPCRCWPPDRAVRHFFAAACSAACSAFDIVSFSGWTMVLFAADRAAPRPGNSVSTPSRLST